MSYYFLYQKKGIPSWLAYTFIFIMTIGISLSLRTGSVKVVSRADKNLVPKQITVSNLTNKTATIYFTTAEPAEAQIKITSPNSASFLRFDLRDSQKQTKRQLHYFQLDQLKQNTQYQAELLINGKLAKQTLTFKTLPFEYPTLNNAPVFGKVVKTDLTPSEDTLVTVKIDKESPYTYSSLTKNTGEWIITFPFLLDKKQQEVNLDKETVLTLKLWDNSLKKTTVLVKYKDTQPLRSLVLGQNYDFTKTDLVLGVKNRQTNRLITAPGNNSSINSAYPAFRGQANKNSLVKVVIEPNVANLLISTDDVGNWQYVPLQPLTTGQYQLTAKQGDQQETINFQITKSGEAVLGEATPSATLTTTPIATPTAMVDKISPTIIPSPTIQVIVPSSSMITPTVVQEEIPRLGYQNNFLIVLASTLSLLGLFLVLY